MWLVVGSSLKEQAGLAAGPKWIVGLAPVSLRVPLPSYGGGVSGVGAEEGVVDGVVEGVVVGDVDGVEEGVVMQAAGAVMHARAAPKEDR